MLDQINNELSRILKDIRRQERIRQLLEVKDKHLDADKEELQVVEKELEKANSNLQKIKSHSPKSALLNLIGNHSKKLSGSRKRLKR